MAKYYDEEGNEQRGPRPRPISTWSLLVLIIVLLLITMTGTIGGIRLMQIWPFLTSAPQSAAPAPAGNVGGQAPPSVHGTNPDPVVAPIATPIPGIAQSEAESLRSYQATAQASLSAPEAAQPIQASPIAAPLPLNSAGAPVIDETQQQQLDQSAQMAADEQQAALRAAQLADSASRAPDVPRADAEQLLHRDLCHVPHADPHTCDRGLFKPTPVQP